MKLIVCLLSFTFAVLLCQHEGGVHAQTRKKQTARARQVEPARQKEAPAPPMPIMPDIRNDPDVEAADVALIANVTIKELRFDAVPNPTVEFLGKPKTSNIWHADRYNLPDQVQPGVTYRNVGIRLKITSRLADIDRIVAEALGEIPISDNSETREKDSPQATIISTAKQKGSPNSEPAASPLVSGATSNKRTE